jgi:nitroimidazol reductase NimA-like FMN-containing flavoprotein (pyridoxamine 5'-phosphate oxidase superfamily)
LEDYKLSVKLPKMSEDEIEKLVEEQMLCRIAFKGDQHPYIAPFQYIRINGTLYFHFTDYGKRSLSAGTTASVSRLSHIDPISVVIALSFSVALFK